MIETRKSIIGLLLLVILSPVYAQQPKTAKQFSLQQAIDYALENNTEILNADLENQIAKKQVGEFLANGLPQVSASLDISRNLELQRSFVPENAFNPAGNPENVVALGFGVPNLSMGGIRLEQMIFDGSFFIGLKAARTFTELSRKQHIKSKVDVVEAVTKAYYSVLINYKMTELVAKNHSRLDSLLNDTKLLYENGFVEKIDVDRIQVQYNNSKVEYDHVNDMVDMSELLFKYQIGLELDVPVTLTDNIEKIELEHRIEINDQFDYKNRIEYSTLLTQKELNNIDLTNTKSQYLPKLNLYASYGGNVGALHTSDVLAFGDWYSFSTIGVNAKWQIFDGFRKKNVAQQKRFKAQQIDNDLDTVIGGIEIEIDQNLRAYNKNIDNMKAQKQNMELAQSIYETSELKYKEGVGSNSEVLDADASLKQAQTNYYNSLFDALVSKVELQKALGELHK